MGNRLKISLPLLGLMGMITAAFFSKGFHHFDEHFQILEFAAAKLGLASASELPWEYEARVRSSFQPWLVIFLHKGLQPLNADNPFWITTFLRLISALLSWAATFLLLKQFKNDLALDVFKKGVAPFSFLFFLNVYNGVRFSSENWGAIFFVLGLCLVDPQKTSGFRRALFAGLLLGISFLCRFQMGLMISGLGAWLLGVKKEPPLRLFALVWGFLIALGSGVLLDHFFYGEWPLTFLNYFEQNLLLNKAASFGVQPWYEYVKWLTLYWIPPFSVFFIFGFFVFFWFYPKHVFSFCLVPFLVAHFVIGHKEARFLFPVLYFLPLMLGMSFEKLALERRFFPKKLGFWKKGISVFWGFNGFLLLAVMFHPADKDIDLYQAVYQSGRTFLWFEDINPYDRAGGRVQYYRRPELQIKEHKPGERVDVPSVWVTPLNVPPPQEGLKLLYQSAPRWITLFNWNHWTDRARLWNLFLTP